MGKNIKNIGRRHFLRGMGGFTLALPLLPSLMESSEAIAQTLARKKRFLTVVSRLGYMENVFYPTVDADKQFANNVFYKALNEIPGPLSAAFGNEFDGLRSKMNIIRGVDVVCRDGHSSVPALCAARDDDEDKGLYSQSLPNGTSRSIDVILSLSKNFYPSPPAHYALRGGGPGGIYNQGGGGYCFDRDKATNERIILPFTASPKLMFDQVFAGRASDPNVQERIKAGRILIGDLVLEDYNRLKNDRRLSTLDKQRVDNVIEHLHATHRNLASQQAPLACSTPPIEKFPTSFEGFTSEDQKQRYYKNYFDVILSAMACDLTRVGVVGFVNSSYLHDHGLSHITNPKLMTQEESDQTRDLLRTMSSLVRNCAEKMNSIIDADGSAMLDNSILHWTFEHGTNHTHASKQAISFGSAGGMIKTGYYMDYRRRPFVHVDGYSFYPAVGLSLNQLFVTYLRALGVPPSEYLQYGDGKGLGSFIMKTDELRRYYADVEQFRNNPLPFIANFT